MRRWWFDLGPTVEKSRSSRSELELANNQLQRSNADLRVLADFASGLAANVSDSNQLTSYACTSLRRLIGARVSITVGAAPPSGAIPIMSTGGVVGGLLIQGCETERWVHLQDAVVAQLGSALQEATEAEELRKTHLETIAALSRSIEAKDNHTRGDTERVSGIAVGLAKRLSYTGADLNAIELGALTRDIGKIVIPESIRHKPGPLDNDEWIVMKRHPVISELILKEIDLSPIVTEIARSSHERMDGQGYPDGLTGDEIPLPARIVLVAEAFDALTTDRPYRRARRPKVALDEIVASSGDQFCPKVVDALKRLYVEEPAVLGEVVLSVVTA